MGARRRNMPAVPVSSDPVTERRNLQGEPRIFLTLGPKFHKQGRLIKTDRPNPRLPPIEPWVSPRPGGASPHLILPHTLRSLTRTLLSRLCRHPRLQRRPSHTRQTFGVLPSSRSTFRSIDRLHLCSLTQLSLTPCVCYPHNFQSPRTSDDNDFFDSGVLLELSHMW